MTTRDEIEVRSPRTLACGVAKAWGARAPKGMIGYRDVLVKLEALGPEPTPEQVVGVLGNSSWTGTECDQCRAENVPVAVFGKEDCEGAYAHICLGCLEAALEKLRG